MRSRIYAGYPYVARQLCSRIISLVKDRPLEVEEDHVVRGVEEYLAQRGDYFQGIFEGLLGDAAGKLMLVLAASESSEVLRSELLLQAESEDVKRRDLERVLEELELFYLLGREQDRYHIRSALARRWIRRNWLGRE